MTIIKFIMTSLLLNMEVAGYGNPNMTKLSKFKRKGVKVQSLHMEGCKRSMLQI